MGEWQVPPDSSGHWQRPPSRVQTWRFTEAGSAGAFGALLASGWAVRFGGALALVFCRGFSTSPLRDAWRRKRRSRPASRISSVVALGWTWERAARAASSLSRKRFETVT